MKILAINPGSTSTKIAVFEDETAIFSKNVPQDGDGLESRVATINAALGEAGIDINDCDAFAGRGGCLKPCVGGTFPVNEVMLSDAKSSPFKHPAGLGCQIADAYARQYGGKAFIVNPPDVDEFIDEARVTGIKGLYRECRTHALNQKETAIRVARDLGGSYEEMNFVVAHLGGGVSVTAHRRGEMIDTNDIINGDGPMTPTRAGTLPTIPLIDICFSGKYTRDEVYARLVKKGGFLDHLGTDNAQEVSGSDDPYFKLIYRAFAYQVGKYIGSMAAALNGKVDAIILTGGIANDKSLVSKISEMTSFIAPIEVRAGEFEMEALAAGVIRVLKGIEEPQEYTGVPPFGGFSCD